MRNTSSRLAELAEDWKEMIKRYGILRAISPIAWEFFRLPYRHLRFLIIACSLSRPLPDFPPKISIDIRPFEQTDLQAVREINCPSEARLCARRLEHGHYGLVAYYKNIMAGYAWGYTKIDPQLERVAIELQPGDVLCNDVFTNPIYRGKGVQTALTLARFNLFLNLGFRRAICYIKTNNLPSLSVWQRKLGGITVGSIDFMRIGPWYKVRSYKATLSESRPVGERV